MGTRRLLAGLLAVIALGAGCGCTRESVVSADSSPLSIDEDQAKLRQRRPSSVPRKPANTPAIATSVR